jgi:hypothetical protein
MRSRLATLLAIPALLGAAAPAAAQDGGGTGGATPDDAPVAPLTVGGLMGGDVKWSGTVAGPGNVSIQRLDPASGAWNAIASATAADDGTFAASWLADALGDESVRAVLDGSDPSAAPVATATVFRGARATWYGPGFYGHRLACGGRLRTTTMGVAHRKLPCGTPVQVFYNGRSVTVPVVDRGPFANGASYDLTGAVAEALGVKETTRVGVLPKPAAGTATAKKPKAKAASRS